MKELFALLPLISMVFTPDKVGGNSVQTQLPSYIKSTEHINNDFSETQESSSSITLDKIVQNDQSIILRTPFVHQIEDLSEQGKIENGGSACGPATIATLLHSNGFDITLDEVISKLPEEVYIKGVMFYELALGPREFGKTAIEVKNDPKVYYELLSQGHPIALNIQNYDGVTGHAVTIVGILNFDGETAESLIVHDPLKGPYREFKYISNSTLQQPEGWYNPIGIIDPFYII